MTPGMSDPLAVPGTATAVAAKASGSAKRGGAPDHAANPAELPEGTLVELFFRAIDEFDKADALLHRSALEWEPISHRRVLADVHALADALVHFGVERGDRVGILAENRAEWLIADYALLCIGAVVVPIYPSTPSNQAAHVLAHAGVRMLFVSTIEQLTKVQQIRAELPYLEQVVLFDDAVAEEVVHLRELLERGRAEPTADTEFRMRALHARPHDVATIIYTSGTTGAPKGAMLTHNNLHSNVLAAVSVNPAGPADVSLSFLPLSHSFQRMVDYGLFAYGCTIAHVGSFNDVARALKEVQPTLAVAVPRVYEKVYTAFLTGNWLRRTLTRWARQVAIEWARATLGGRSPGLMTQLQHALADRFIYGTLRDRMGGRIRFMVSGGAPLSPQIAYFFYGAGILILEGYGLTETSPVVTVNTVDDFRIGTVGRPVAGTEIRIAEDGEVLVRGPQVMRGYYEDEAATRAVIDEQGWFHTGDLGALDAGGYLRITDRKKDLLVTAGGKNVAPQPIQNAAKRSRFISEAVLIGDRRPYPIMLVVPNFGNLEGWAKHKGVRWRDRSELVADARVRRMLTDDVLHKLEGFARYELPKKVLPLERELSLEQGEITPTLKVRRRIVEQRFSDRIEAAYAEPAPGAAGP